VMQHRPRATTWAQFSRCPTISALSFSNWPGFAVDRIGGLFGSNQNPLFRFSDPFFLFNGSTLINPSSSAASTPGKEIQFPGSPVINCPPRSERPLTGSPLFPHLTRFPFPGNPTLFSPFIASYLTNSCICRNPLPLDLLQRLF